VRKAWGGRERDKTKTTSTTPSHRGVNEGPEERKSVEKWVGEKEIRRTIRVKSSKGTHSILSNGDVSRNSKERWTRKKTETGIDVAAMITSVGGLSMILL